MGLTDTDYRQTQYNRVDLEEIPMRLFLLFALLMSAACGGKGAGDDAKVLSFSAIPDENPTLLKEKYDPVAEYLSEKLGITVKYVPATKYSASVEMFKNGQIQLAWFGGLTGVQARAAVPGAKAIAQGIEDPQYVSYFIAHKDTGLTESKEFPAAIKDLTFTFGSESSTSGRLMPEFFIRKFAGKTPDEFFSKKFQFSGAHDKTAYQVQDGTVQAGALSYKKYESMVKSGKIDPKVCRKIWTTPTYADYNFTAHPDLNKMFGPDFTDKLQKTLLEMSDPKLLAAFQRAKFIPAKNEEFDGIVETAKALKLLR